MKFESLHPKLLDEATSLACSHFPLRGIDTGEWNKHIGILSSNFGNFLIRNTFYPSSRLHIYWKNDASHLAFPVVSRNLRNSHMRSFFLKVMFRCFLESLPTGITWNPTRNLSMSMHVNRHQVLYIHVSSTPMFLFIHLSSAALAL